MRALAGVVVLLFFQGCAQVQINRTSASNPPRAEVVSVTKRSIVFGFHTLGGPINVAYYCPNGWTRITNRKTFSQGLLTVLTANLYSPWTVEMECQQGS